VIILKNYNKIISWLEHNKTFNLKEFREFYHTLEEDVPDSTIRWIVYKLKSNNIIHSVGRGKYIMNNKKDNKPFISDEVKNIYNFLNNKFMYSDIYIWDSKFLNDFMEHQPFSKLIIIEVDKDIKEFVFDELKQNYNSVFLDPDKVDIEKYIIGKKKCIIVKNIISRSPIINYEGIKTPKLEKILVDLLVDKNLFYFYQGKEMTNIFNNISKQYNINQNTLNNYLKRRSSKNLFSEIKG